MFRTMFRMFPTEGRHEMPINSALFLMFRMFRFLEVTGARGLPPVGTIRGHGPGDPRSGHRSRD
jgi:hypothetical protein